MVNFYQENNFINCCWIEFYARNDSGQKSKGPTNHFATKILQSKIKIKRPIIFICNDSYVKSLKELRKRALVFNFKKPETSKLMKRLYEICVQEVTKTYDFEISNLVNSRNY